MDSSGFSRLDKTTRIMSHFPLCTQKSPVGRGFDPVFYRRHEGDDSDDMAGNESLADEAVSESHPLNIVFAYN